MVLASSAQEAVWMRQLSSEIGIEYTKPVIIYEDNQSAIAMTINPQFHGRTKHIAIKYHYIREQVNDGTCINHNLSKAVWQAGCNAALIAKDKRCSLSGYLSSQACR